MLFEIQIAGELFNYETGTDFKLRVRFRRQKKKKKYDSASCFTKNAFD